MANTVKEFLGSDSFATIVVAAASFTDTFMYDVAVPFLPYMLKDRLGLNPDETQHFTSTTLAIFGGAQLVTNVIAAYTTDHLKSKQIPFLFGLLFLTASVPMFFLGKHVAVILTSRALQGMSAAFVWVSGLALLTSRVENRRLGIAIGMVNFAMTIGELIGPISGGFLYEYGGHYAVMGLALGILGVDIVLRLLLQDKPQKGQANSNEEQRPLVEGNGCFESEGAGTPSVRACDSEAILSLQNDDPGEEDLLRQPSSRRTAIKDIACSWWAILVTGTIRSTIESTAPFFVEREFGWSASASSAIMFALLSPAVISPWIGRYASKNGPRWISVFCYAVNSLAFVGLAFLHNSDTVIKVGFVVLIVTIGTTGALMTTVHTVAFSVTAKTAELEDAEGKKSQAGKSFGSMTVAWALAMLIGPLLADFFLQTVSRSGLCAFLAAICLATSLLTTISWRNWETLE